MRRPFQGYTEEVLRRTIGARAEAERERGVVDFDSSPVRAAEAVADGHRERGRFSDNSGVLLEGEGAPEEP